MAKTTRKAGKRAAAAGRGGLRGRKSGVAKTHNVQLRELKPAKPEPRKGKPSLPSETARLKRQLKAARTQQEASAEILRAVANASGDATGPLQLIAETTARLFKASSVSIQLAEGSEFTQEYRVGAIARRVGSANPRSMIKVGGRNLPGTVVAENRQIHIPDLDQLDPSMSDFPGLPHARAGGARTVCGTPLRREHKAIGALIVFRDRLLAFTGDELALLQSFADKAVIAIENTRLFNETKEALERQTATADILRVISLSPTDVQPVFNALVLTAQRLLRRQMAFILLCEDGTSFRPVAITGPEGLVQILNPAPIPIDPEVNFPSRAIVSKKNQQFPDWSAIDLPEEERKIREMYGLRSALYLPMLRGGECIGVLGLGGRQPGSFSETEIALAESFRDQAVIAIENARLFNETREALERQTATSDILNVIAGSPTDTQPVFDAIARSAAELCEATNSGVFCLRDGLVHLAGHHNLSPEQLAFAPKAFPAPLHRGYMAGRAIVDRAVAHVPDIAADPDYSAEAIVRAGFRSAVSVPMFRNGEPIGAINVTREEARPFSVRQIELLKTFADQAVIAIENTRLFNEVGAKTRDLTESLQQQTATADVLKVISRSAFDLDSVMHTLAHSAAELCAAGLCGLYIREDDFLVCRGYTAISKEQEEFVRRARIPAFDPDFATTRVLSSGEIANIGEFKNDRSVATQAFQEKLGFKSLLIVPLMREGQGIGLFILGRDRVGQFSARHVELVQTFADQAVIAIENARLFDEVQARTRDLGEALEQQTATSAVLAVISRSPSDLNPVLEAISDTAARLCGSEQTMFFRYDGNVFRILASWNFPPEVHEMLERRPLMPGHPSAIGRAGVSLKPVCIPDVLADPAYGLTGEQSRARYRATLAVPLLREGQLVGALSLNRSEPGAFTEKQIELVATFADQAVIAIENTRLFNETQEALERQTATAEILKVIASSPDDLQPVFEAIAERSNRLVSGLSTTVLSIADDTIHLSAFTRTNPEADAALTSSFPRQLSSMPFGEPIRQGAIYSLPDTETEPALRDLARMRGYRSMLFVPLLRNGAPIGMIGQTRVEPGPFADHHIEMLKTFADQAVIAISNVKLFRQVQERTRELSQSLDDLRTAQDRLVQTEKLASLGQLTAGIAHEIKNPLNFVNNFSALSVELIDEMTEIFENPALDEAGRRKELDEIRELLKSNLEKVVQHGKRADSIVKNMLLHSREGSGEQRAVDINALLDESLNLAYHGARAEKPGFNIKLQRDLDPDAGVIELFPQEITRALLNLISNGFYAASKREAENGEADFEPALSAATKNLGNHIEIRIRDNGTGIPPEVKEKMFNPFFTTKPAGEGTGLGLSMSHDIIVKQHGGRIEVDTQPGQFTELTIVLPRAATPANNRKD